MSQDDVSVAIQSCFGLIKEVQRRVDSAWTASIDLELRQHLKLARIALLKATKKESVTTSGDFTEVNNSSPSQSSKSDGKRGGTAATPAILTSSFDPTSTNKQRNDIFKSAPLWSVVLCGFQWNKRKLCEQALTTLQHLLRCRAVNLEIPTTFFLSPYISGGGAADVHESAGTVRHTKAMCRVGEGVFMVLGEYLGTVSEPAIQTRVLSVLQGLIEGKGQAFFVGKTVTRTIHAAFTVALLASQEAVRAKSQHFLQLCVVRVTRGFAMESTGRVDGFTGFATNTVLEDYTLDVEFDAPFTRIDVVEPAPPGTQARQRGHPHNGSLSPNDNEGLHASLSPPPQGETDGTDSAMSGRGSLLDPSSFFQSSLDESVVRETMGVLSQDARLPQLLKDFIALLKNTCRLATRPLTGSPTEGNAEVRARHLALRMLERLFHELPVANCEAEHRCATWLSLALTACRYDIIRTLVRNFGVVVPFTFFESAIHILWLILRKCHYHMARELHSLLAVYLLPLASSPYCDFRQKHAVLAMTHELFRIPHLLVSFFINYDCSPTFDAGGKYGGTLELLVDFVVDMTFADIVALDGDEEEDWLNSDQQQLLRGECVVALHALVKSMHRWIAEDPQSYASSLYEARHSGKEVRDGGREGARDEWAELYLDNWASDAEDGEGEGMRTPKDGPLPRVTSEAVSSAEGTGAALPHGHSVSFTTDPLTGGVVPLWGKRRDIHYHWKHIHFLMHNKRIALDAVELVNAGKWKEAKDFLESRRYMPSRTASPEEAKAMESKDVSAVPPGASSFAELARFLSQYPGISRDAISGIFDRINKDPASKLLLRDYLHLFHYQGIPIDTALRDTTCKFMSWDRPMFEAQVWETIQGCFGEEYARQNPGVITAKDADTMAGVLLFLHSNLHNDIAKSSRFNVDQFVRDANACLDIPMEPHELRAVFARVQRRKWELDACGRTPAEAERAAAVPSVSFKVMTQKLIQDQAQRASEQAARQAEEGQLQWESKEAAEETAATEECDDTSTNRTSAAAELSAKSPVRTIPLPQQPPRPPPPPPRSRSGFASSGSPSSLSSPALSQGMLSNRADVTLLDAGMPSYTDNRDNVKLREDHHIAFTRVAGLYAAKLEAVHSHFAGDRDSYHPQPYVVPHYAEHVRPMLLCYYPCVMACVFMGFRVLEAAPLSRQLLDITQTLYDIGAAFVVNLGDMHDAVHATIQRCLANEHAYRLTPPTRATFVPFLLNNI